MRGEENDRASVSSLLSRRSADQSRRVLGLSGDVDTVWNKT